MRVFCFLSSCLLICSLSSAQSFQKVPLKTIIAEAPNDFGAFKGELNTVSEDDSFYSSTVTIEGSKNNEISQLPGRLTQYHAYIADSATKKRAKNLVEEWRSKIKAASPGYIEEALNSTFQKRTTTGYRFSKVISRELYSISIVYSKREIDSYYWVLLTITRQGKAVLDDEGGSE
ncbi:MAG TPA: hypothetical protein VF609_08030 [Flavisolibacter sp.]|jgi:hypothetical protein